MMNNIGDMLDKSRFAEPPEIRIIKDFVREKFASPASVGIKENQIIITVSNAALAGTLRLHLHKLQTMCQTEKRLVIRLGRA